MYAFSCASNSSCSAAAAIRMAWPHLSIVNTAAGSWAARAGDKDKEKRVAPCSPARRSFSCC